MTADRIFGPTSSALLYAEAEVRNLISIEDRSRRILIRLSFDQGLDAPKRLSIFSDVMNGLEWQGIDEEEGYMVWLEVISIRTAGIDETARAYDICKQIFRSIAVEKLLRFTIYCNAKYATDISIHLHWSSDPGYWSLLGSKVSSELADLGLISHTLWVERERG